MTSRLSGPMGTDTNNPTIDHQTIAKTTSPLPGPQLSTPPALVTERTCPCSGKEKTTISGLAGIQSFSGEFPSPLQVMWYVPSKNEPLRLSVPDKEIRQWIQQAAEYHGIPHILLATILQQENAPSASGGHKILQFGERTVTTFAAIVDKALWDIVPDSIAGGSSGFANMSRRALNSAATYSEKMYGRSPLPVSIRYRIFGWDQDTRISGDDWKADLYYCAAHLRQLIDRITGRPCHNGPINIAQLEKVIAAYNGSGPLAKKYAKDAIRLLSDASAGKAALYFYEQ